MDINKLKGTIPQAVIDELPVVIDKFSINTPLRLAHFLSNASHESGKFTRIVENMNYDANRLMVVFPKYFTTLKFAKTYERKLELIANRVYGDRMGNGNELSGDGWKYRGRGYFQLTGFNNYRDFDKFVNDDILKNPDLVATKYPLLSAGWFWHKNNINNIADKGDSSDVCRSVRKIINGGTIGLEETTRLFIAYYKLLK
jgi:putative chitinase